MSGLHDICHANERRQSEVFIQAMAQMRAAAGADALIGQAIRELLLPGVRRRTWRAEELREIVDRADRRFGLERTP